MLSAKHFAGLLKLYTLVLIRNLMQILKLLLYIYMYVYKDLSLSIHIER